MNSRPRWIGYAIYIYIYIAIKAAANTWHARRYRGHRVWNVCRSLDDSLSLSLCLSYLLINYTVIGPRVKTREITRHVHPCVKINFHSNASLFVIRNLWRSNLSLNDSFNGHAFNRKRLRYQSSKKYISLDDTSIKQFRVVCLFYSEYYLLQFFRRKYIKSRSLWVNFLLE